MSKRAIAVVAAGFLTLSIAFAIRYSYGLILPYMLTTLAISKTQAGVIFSSYFLTATLLSPLFGFLSDRFDTRIILSLFVAILGVGTLLMSLTTSVLQASIFFAIAGIGHSACWAPVVTVVMRWASPKARGVIVSVVDLGTTTGIAIWSLIIPVIIVGGSWRSVWVYLGMTALVVAGLNFFLIRSYPDTHYGISGAANNTHTVSPLKGVIKIILKDKKFYLIGFSYLLISFSILIPFTFLTSFATQKLQIPYSSATSLLIVIAVAGTLGKLILAHISDRSGRIKIMMLCGMLTAGGAGGMAYAEQLATLITFALIFGVGYGSLWAIYAASARDLFPSECAGSIIGLWTVFHGLGSIVAPVVSGWMIDTTGEYFWAFMLAVISSLMAAALLIPLLQLDGVKAAH